MHALLAQAEESSSFLSDFFSGYDWTLIGVGFAYIVLGGIVLLVAKLLKDLMTPYSIDAELTAKDNPALGLALMGYFAGVIIIFLGSSVGEITADLDSGGALAWMIGKDALWALAGIIALNITRVVTDKLLLPQFSTTKEIIEDRNLGTGAVEAGSCLAIAFVVAGAINGTGGGWWSALTFFVLGQIVLILFGLFYQWMTKYDIHAEIEKDNVAAGVAFGMSIVAIGVIMFRATKGEFVDWATNLSDFGYYAVFGFVTLLILRKLTDGLLLPGATIYSEIAQDRNINAALIEGTVAVGVACMIVFML